MQTQKPPETDGSGKRERTANKRPRNGERIYNLTKHCPESQDFNLVPETGEILESPSADKEYMSIVLRVENLHVRYEPVRLRGWWARQTAGEVVRGISFEIQERQTFGLIGESGSGKSTTAKAILQITRPHKGSVHLNGRDLCKLQEKALQSMRGAIGMIFQDLDGALNPRMRIGCAIEEPLKLHSQLSRAERRARVQELLRQVGLETTSIEQYPHEFSGGQRQRICIARAIALHPPLLLADEPVSSLDCSVQGQILNLLTEIQKNLGTAILFISHNLAVVRRICHRIGVMREGEILEEGECEEVLVHPRNEYTKKLIQAAGYAFNSA
jgi:peptide/nickel transport system ATP-binding protein